MILVSQKKQTKFTFGVNLILQSFSQREWKVKLKKVERLAKEPAQAERHNIFTDQGLF